MKKYRFAIIITLLLAILAIFLVTNNKKGNMKQRNNEFAVNDTSNVTKVFIADKNNSTVKLERIAAGNWKVNEKFKANSESVNMILKTMLLLDVKAPVAKNARNTIIRLMAGKSVKVEIYQWVYRINIFNWIKLFPHEKRTKTYYVGDATMDNMGTFMLMDGSEDPYIVHIPGFRGFVASRYSAIEADWRDHAIFNSKLPDIKKVSLRFPDMPQNSFSINNSNNRNFVLTALMDNSVVKDFDTLKVIQYLGGFYNINFEALINEMDQKKVDSILVSPPSVVITVEDKSGKQYILKAWRRKAAEGERDLEDKPVIWDRDRMYANIEGTHELVTIQFFVFDAILKPLGWFTDKSSGSNGVIN